MIAFLAAWILGNRSIPIIAWLIPVAMIGFLAGFFFLGQKMSDPDRELILTFLTQTLDAGDAPNQRVERARARAAITH